MSKPVEDITDVELNGAMDEYKVSYWDVLPVEIQEYICLLASTQHERDHEKMKSKYVRR